MNIDWATEQESEMNWQRKPKQDRVLQQAQQLMLAETLPSIADLAWAHQKLQQLDQSDPFWIYWSEFLERFKIEWRVSDPGINGNNYSIFSSGRCDV